MKNIFKSIALLLVSLGALASCTPEESFLYYPDNECVTFEKSSVNFSFAADADPIVINLVRGVIDKDLTVNLTLTQDDANIFSISATSVNFPAGEKYASVEVTYDFEAVPDGKHTFTVSFDKAMQSPAGNCSITGTATKASKPKGDGWMSYATVEMYSSRMNSSVTLDEEQHSVLQVSYDNKNDYRIKNILNSGIDLYINVDPDNGWTITGPEATECPYDGESYIKIPSTIKYQGELVTFWIDPTPKYLKVYDMGTDYGEEYTMSMGSDWYTELKAYVWMTTESKGVLTWPEDNDGEDDGWWPIYYDVIDFKPLEDSKYMDYATVEMYSSRMNSSVTLDAEQHSILQVSTENKNDYRIKNILNSGIDLKINVDPTDGWTITGPAAEECPYDGESYIKIPSTIKYQGELVTFWIDPTPKYLKVFDMGTEYGEEYTMSMGSDWYTELKAYVWMTTESKGVLTWPEDNDGEDDGWWPIYYDVIDFGPQEDAKYIDYATVEMYSSRMNSSVTLDAEQHSVLAYHSENKNNYRIKNILNSGINLDINVDPTDGWTITGPAAEECPYDGESYIKIPSTITYQGEPVTFWIDPTPKYLKVFDMGTEYGEEFTMSMGSDWYTELKAYVWMTTESKGVLTWPEDNDGEDDGWWPIYYDVIEIL